MKTRLGVVVLLLVAAIGWILWSADDSTAVNPAQQTPSNRTPPEHIQPPAPIALQRHAPPPLTPSSARAFHGTVTTFPHTPVAGATVHLHADPVTATDHNAPLVTVETDAAGKFRIPVAVSWPATCTLVVEAPQFVSETKSDITADATIDVHLRQRFDLFGRVLAKDSSLPLSGATIRGGESMVTTDADGYYELVATGVRGETWLQASCTGHADERVHVRLHDRKRTRVDIALQPTTAITVQIVDAESHAPISGAEVRKDRRSDIVATADPNGCFQWSVAADKPVWLMLGATGYCTIEWNWEVTTVPTEPLRLPLIREATLTGKVTTFGGEPLAGSWLLAQQESRPFGRRDLWPELRRELGLPGKLSFDLNRHCRARTDEEGRYRIVVVPDTGPYRVKAGHEGLVASVSRPHLLTVPGASAQVDFRLTRGGTIVGSALRNGEPWRGPVFWMRADGSFGGRTETDAKGHYELRDVAPGPIEVVVRARTSAEFQRAALTVESNREHQQDFAWEESTSTIQGRVTSQSGEPAAGVRVRAVSFVDRAVTSVHATTDEGGNYVIEVKPPGPFTVSLWHAGVPRKLENVAPGATGVDFLLPELGLLRLRLVEASTGQPVAAGDDDLHGVAWKPSGEEVFHAARERLDSTGLIELRVPIGRVDVSFHLQNSGYAPLVAPNLLVTPEPNPSAIPIELVGGVEVVLEVEDHGAFAKARKDHLVFLLERSQLGHLRGPFPNQAPPSNHRINGVCMRVAQPGLLNQMVYPDETGRAAFTGLRPGRYRLVAFPSNLTFTPSEFGVGENDATISITWQKQ